MLLTDVPDDFVGRGYPPAQTAADFGIALDRAEPWGGGRVEGRIERRSESRDERPIEVSLRCDAAWIDVAPQLVGQKRFFSFSTYWDLRTRGVPIWLDELAWSAAAEIGSLEDANWRSFEFAIPGELPRAFEGTFASFRWRVVARRPRRLGHAVVSVPLIFREPQPIPCVRIETTPIGTWRLLEWRSEAEKDGAVGGCRVRYEPRRAHDMPEPGETREQELRRRMS